MKLNCLPSTRKVLGPNLVGQTALSRPWRALKDDEFKKERPELEKTARQIVGEVGPLDVLRHAVERSLADLLSNPRLAAAIDARLKK